MAELDSFSKKRQQLIDPGELARERESLSEAASVVQTLQSLLSESSREARKRSKVLPMVTDPED